MAKISTNTQNYLVCSYVVYSFSFSTLKWEMKIKRYNKTIKKQHLVKIKLLKSRIQSLKGILDWKLSFRSKAQAGEQIVQGGGGVTIPGGV